MSNYRAGKAYSNAAAVAYKVESDIRTSLTTTANTSSLCSWIDMSRRKADPAPMSCIDFKRPKYGEDVRRPKANPNPKDILTTSTPLDFASLKRIQINAVVFSLLEVKRNAKTSKNYQRNH